MKIVLLAALTGALLLPSCQTTQQHLKPGMTRTAVAFSYSDMSTPAPVGDSTNLTVEGAYGTFYQADQEIGFKVNYSKNETELTGSTDQWMLAMYGRYYLATQEALLPWVELDLGWADATAGSGFAWSAGVGITQFVTEGGAIEASIDYQDITGDADTSGFRALIGYAIFF
jgi:hypothetical protein